MAIPSLHSVASFSSQHGSRKFYDISSHTSTASLRSLGDKSELLYRSIRNNLLSSNCSFETPFGHRISVYCDYTASGQSLQFIEDFIQENVLSEYGNTHTTTSSTSLQTTLLRHEARDIIKQCTNCGENDCVLFVGAGCTGAVHKLIQALGLSAPPIIFVGPYEHHSTILPWRELGSDVIRINEDADGTVDLDHLERCLKDRQSLSKSRQLIGCFCAASNITGTVADVDKVAVLLHKYGALALFDYATAAPYVEIDMNPVLTRSAYKDAVFISVHKFVGGVQTPGLLIAKKRLFRSPVPYCGGGGGAVFFVRREGHRYLQDIENREEAGTPDIVGSIRAGLVFQLKRAVGESVIAARDKQIVSRVFDAFEKIPSLAILGARATRLPIFSFLVRHPGSGLYLHYNFVSVLLNDLFGIQSRGGCACAGPYAQDLLGIDENLAILYERLLLEDSRLDRHHLRRRQEGCSREILRPGFTRLNFAYFLSEEETQFIIDAVIMIAEEGWKLLPQYKFNPETGEWHHKKFQSFKYRKWLEYISYESGQFEYNCPKFVDAESAPWSFNDCLSEARKIFETAHMYKEDLPDQRDMFDDVALKYRWFLLPSEAQAFLENLDYSYKTKYNAPFVTVKYPLNSEANKTDRKEEYSEVIANISGPTEFAKEINGDVRHSEKCAVCESDTTQHIKLFLADDGYTHARYSEIPLADADLSQLTEASALEDSQEQGSDQILSCPVTSSQQSDSTVGGHSNIKTNTEVELVNETEEIVRHKWHCPPKAVMNLSRQAIAEYNMIQNGDRILVCLSGGKDSLSLLHTIRQYQFIAKKQGIEFDFGAVTVDPQTPSYNPKPLQGYLAVLGTPYFLESQGIIKQAMSLPYACESICSFCSRMKRGRLYACARKNGYNVLAFGQHLDDLAETFMMSAFHNGALRTMKAHYTVKDGDLRVIRPFIYVRERDLREFAYSVALPVIPENCPACFEAPKERHRVKQLLAQQEILFPRLFQSIMSTIKPLMSTGGSVSSYKPTYTGDIDLVDIEDDDE